MSNATFVVGIVTFLPTLVALTGAHKVFHGIGYFFKLLFNKNAKQEFPTYRDYKEHNRQSQITIFKELLIGSLIVFVVGIALAVVVMMQT